MKIRLSDIANKFEGVLSRTLAREEADRWAQSMMDADDAGNLEILPVADRDRIWRGLTYLHGIDLPHPDGSGFLHSLEDIFEAYSKLNS